MGTRSSRGGKYARILKLLWIFSVFTSFNILLPLFPESYGNMVSFRRRSDLYSVDDEKVFWFHIFHLLSWILFIFHPINNKLGLVEVAATQRSFSIFRILNIKNVNYFGDLRRSFSSSTAAILFNRNTFVQTKQNQIRLFCLAQSRIELEGDIS